MSDPKLPAFVEEALERGEFGCCECTDNHGNQDYALRFLREVLAPLTHETFYWNLTDEPQGAFGGRWDQRRAKIKQLLAWARGGES